MSRNYAIHHIRTGEKLTACAEPASFMARITSNRDQVTCQRCLSRLGKNYPLSHFVVLDVQLFDQDEMKGTDAH
jgi:hypothetical protein